MAEKKKKANTKKMLQIPFNLKNEKEARLYELIMNNNEFTKRNDRIKIVLYEWYNNNAEVGESEFEAKKESVLKEKDSFDGFVEQMKMEKNPNNFT